MKYPIIIKEQHTCIKSKDNLRVKCLEKYYKQTIQHQCTVDPRWCMDYCTGPCKKKKTTPAGL